MKAPLYTQTGESKGKVDLNSAIFEVKASPDLIQEAVVRYLANRRTNVAKAKTRGEVRGGGRKPWRQKGTGRARQGSIRSPQWRGGGAVFGPTGEENYTKEMPKKMRRKALFASLSSKASEEAVLILDKYESEKPKTKDFKALVDKLPTKRNLLVVISERNEVLEKSAANLPNVEVILVNFLNVHTVLKYEKLLFTKAALDKLEGHFLPKAVAAGS
jgi:large subunit ribosomal protein L4